MKGVRKVSFRTLGCKVNQYETQLIRENFLRMNFVETDGPADIYVVNTCTVTHKADVESKRFIRSAWQENPTAQIVVTGCYTEMDEEHIRRLPGNIMIVKNSLKHRIVELLSDREDQGKDLPGRVRNGISFFKGRSKAFLKIQDGCDNFCSYCKIPFVRGRSISKSLDEIFEELLVLLENGYREIVLCGICLGSWQWEDYDLSGLLSLIEQRIKGEFRIRLSSIEPWYVKPSLLEVIFSSCRICKHLHIPLQSGDDRILVSMRRPYSSDDFLKLIDSIRKLCPDVAFTTDVLVGFPGETEDMFNNTLDVLKLLSPSRIHIFSYSQRNGTYASRLPSLPSVVIHNRTKQVRMLAHRFSEIYKQGFLGRKVNVLVETRRDPKTGHLTGYTDRYFRISFPGPDELMGKLVDVVWQA